MRINHQISLILLGLFVSSCASYQREKEAPQKVQYSKETQKSFEEIEKEMLLERYKRMRVEDGILQERRGREYNPTLRGLPPQVEDAPLARPTPPRPKPRPKPEPKAQPGPKAAEKSSPKRIEVDPQEQRREIEQNLTYFCMKMRNDSRFSSGLSCEEYTQSVQKECLNKFSEGELALTRCVKSQL